MNDEVGLTPPVVTYFTPPSTISPELGEDGTTLLRDNSSVVDRRAGVSKDATQPVLSSSLRLKLRPNVVSASIGHQVVLKKRASGRLKTYARFSNQHDPLFLMDLEPCELLPLPPLNLPLWDESALIEIRGYYDTYWHSTVWESWVDTRHNWIKLPSEFSVKPPDMSPLMELEDPARLVGAFQIATRLYGTASAGEAYSMKDAALEKLEHLIRQQHPQLLSCLLLLICVLNSTGFSEPSSKVLFHTHDMAYVILGSTHHITRLTSLLAHSEDILALVGYALECIQDLYQRRAGHLHPSYLDAAFNHAWSRFQRGRLHEAKRKFLRLNHLYESYAQFDGLRPRKVLYSMAQVEIAQGVFGCCGYSPSRSTTAYLPTIWNCQTC
jgi:hypothetical protein